MRDLHGLYLARMAEAASSLGLNWIGLEHLGHPGDVPLAVAVPRVYLAKKERILA